MQFLNSGLEILHFLFVALAAIFELAIVILIIAMPIIIVYAVYRGIKELMSHNAKLKRRQDEENQP